MSSPTSSDKQVSTGAWLTAVAPDKQVQRWEIPESEVLVGRPEAQEPTGKVTVAGDPTLSRRHFWLGRTLTGLRVRRCPEARNPIFFMGEDKADFELLPGQHFVVGSTTFQYSLSERGSEPPTPAREMTLAHASRQGARERQASECLKAMTELLPRLKRATDEQGQWEGALEVLAGVLPRASSVMALRIDPEKLAGDQHDFYEIIHTYQPFAMSRPLPPSRRLVKTAFKTRETATHLWEDAGGEGLTVQAQMTWALAALVPDTDYCLYAWGGELGSSASTIAMGTEDQPGNQERVLVDLVAETLAHYLVLRQMHQLEGQVGQFFSPALRKLLLQRGQGTILQPARRHVTVLFFDLRGFSKATEKAEDGPQDLDRMLEYHDALTEVMTMVTGAVFDAEGIVVDYQGDAMLACWGAPMACEDHSARAVRTARIILEKLHGLNVPFGTQAPGGRRQIMRCGMGIGCGEVVAGQIGARHQIKYGVMGRVVNQASRLEGLTKYIGVPVLMTADVCAELDDDLLCRRVGRIRPAGMADHVELHELVVPPELGGSGLSPEEVKAYEAGEALFKEGRFMEALGSLRLVPLEDPVGSFLTRRAYQLMDEGAPEGWDGVLEFKAK